MNSYGFWNLHRRMWSYKTERVYILLHLSVISTIWYFIGPDVEFNVESVKAFWKTSLVLVVHIYSLFTAFRIIGKLLITFHIWGAVKFSRCEDKEYHKKSYDDLILHLEIVNKC